MSEQPQTTIQEPTVQPLADPRPYFVASHELVKMIKAMPDAEAALKLQEALVNAHRTGYKQSTYDGHNLLWVAS